MQQTIEQELARLGGRSACVVTRVEGVAPEALVMINADQLFPAASLAKLPILVEVARQVSEGKLAWPTRYTLPKGARVPSSGVLADLSPDLTWSLHDLACLMITISDNSAANVLLDLVGMDAVNATMRKLGLNATSIERRFMDFMARQQGRDNWTTAGDMARLFALLCTHTVPESERMIAILLRQNDYMLLPGYWGEDLPFAHKTGDLVGVSHDAGLLFPPRTNNDADVASLVVVVLTSEQEDQPFTRYTLARIGRLIYHQPDA
ncbi:MAG TPA: serine hydrolase [Ktedonobacteraceae bacterium]|jgi:beta-lactamase class A|nr:serine hydrolase [Ktedonobacteraceae bacterium]